MTLRRRRTTIIALGFSLAVAACNRQGAATTSASSLEPKTWTAAQDHARMMEQLGIQALRPGPSGNEQDANHADYDERKANPFPDLPDVLTLKSGAKVTDARMWWPDSLSLAVDGYLYVTCNQLHRQPKFHNGADLRKKPYYLFRVKTDGTPVMLAR